MKKKLNWKRCGLLVLGLLAWSGCNVPARAQGEPEVQALIGTLFDKDTPPEAFASAVEQGKAAKFPEQVLLEAQLARTLFARDMPALVALKEPLQNMGATLDLGLSHLFIDRKSYDSLVQGVLAAQARQKEDEAGFETHLKEALWLAPEPLQMLYLQWLESYRIEEAMKNVVVPFDRKVDTAQGTQTTLHEVLGGNKALLIDVWATYCPNCMAAMDEKNAKSAKLAAQGVVLAGLNIEGDPAIAQKVKKAKNITMPWLVEAVDGTYNVLLQTDKLPQTVLVSPAGKVLFNGSPNDPALKYALKKIGVNL